ncbi:hypothetical protein [Streptomyces europaeiscabiei]|uniref:hypothetical protein n=1 Tax=Streptomyces europaeiscabiei TaxID=146819 RepID=UPI0029B34A7D|nr:hypothetical protein [Streptomyces europaeiscabiei]MDX3784076.1 hypothetical protein [Streptomyces europaeiscabiei]
MNEPRRLEAADRADFEHTLHEALGTPDLREALRQPNVQVTAEQLHTRALTAADTIAAEAATEYAALLRLRTAAAPARAVVRTRQSAPATVGNGLPAALAVLTPVLSATAAAIFLLLGYGLQLAGAQQPLAITLIRAGWIAGSMAALAAAAAGTGLVITVARHRATSRRPQPDAASLARAQAEWRQALLERGLLPFLHRHLHQPPTPAPPPRPVLPPAQRRTRPGYSSPDFTGPSLPSRD